MARTAQVMTERQALTEKVKAGRFNLLLAILFTVVNIALFIGGSETMLLFSITVPYYAVIFGVFLAALGEDAMMVTGCVIAAVILVVYFCCWLLSKKHIGWMIAALGLMIVDTIALIGFYLSVEEISGILDFVFHAMILYYLIMGITSAKKLSKLPLDEPLVADAQGPLGNSVPLRRIEEGEKCRILLENTYGTYRVIYRRYKKVNQLVINDYIYDEITMTIEPAHSLSACIDGHEFTVGFDGVAHSYFKVDGNEIVKKMRLY